MSRFLVLITVVLVSLDCSADEKAGAEVFGQWCVHCHGTQAAAPGRLKLEWTRGIERSVLSERSDLTADYITAVVRKGQLEMPSFRKTEISDLQLQDLIDYLNRAR